MMVTNRKLKDIYGKEVRPVKKGELEQLQVNPIKGPLTGKNIWLMWVDKQIYQLEFITDWE